MPDEPVISCRLGSRDATYNDASSFLNTLKVIVKFRRSLENAQYDALLNQPRRSLMRQSVMRCISRQKDHQPTGTADSIYYQPLIKLLNPTLAVFRCITPRLCYSKELYIKAH